MNQNTAGADEHTLLEYDRKSGFIWETVYVAEEIPALERGKC